MPERKGLSSTGGCLIECQFRICLGSTGRPGVFDEKYVFTYCASRVEAAVVGIVRIQRSGTVRPSKGYPAVGRQRCPTQLNLVSDEPGREYEEKAHH